MKRFLFIFNAPGLIVLIAIAALSLAAGAAPNRCGGTLSSITAQLSEAPSFKRPSRDAAVLATELRRSSSDQERLNFLRNLIAARMSPTKLSKLLRQSNDPTHSYYPLLAQHFGEVRSSVTEAFQIEVLQGFTMAVASGEIDSSVERVISVLHQGETQPVPAARAAQNHRLAFSIVEVFAQIANWDVVFGEYDGNPVGTFTSSELLQIIDRMLDARNSEMTSDPAMRWLYKLDTADKVRLCELIFQRRVVATTAFYQLLFVGQDGKYNDPEYDRVKNEMNRRHGNDWAFYAAQFIANRPPDIIPPYQHTPPPSLFPGPISH